MWERMCAVERGRGSLSVVCGCGLCGGLKEERRRVKFCALRALCLLCGLRGAALPQRKRRRFEASIVLWLPSSFIFSSSSFSSSPSASLSSSLHHSQLADTLRSTSINAGSWNQNLLVKAARGMLTWRSRTSPISDTSSSSSDTGRRSLKSTPLTLVPPHQILVPDKAWQMRQQIDERRWRPFPCLILHVLSRQQLNVHIIRSDAEHLPSIENGHSVDPLTALHFVSVIQHDL